MSDITLKELKDILDDNELDLSARGLGGVPKALMQVPRATNIDLNSNKITFLLPEFCNMTQIVKLDLGNNKIIFLPDNFGNLVHLQHLSLYNNELENLPMSFANLKALKYLDLKKNPLEPGLLKAAGPCNLEKECKQAAVNVIHHMKQQKLALEAAVAKQEKVNLKIHAKNEEARKAAAAKNKNNKDKKKQQQQKQQEPAAPSKEEISAQMAKKDEKKQQKMDKKSEETTGWFRSILWWTFFLLFCSWVSASVNLSYDCFKYGGGATVPGAKPFCLDLHKLKKFEKPSNKYVENTKVAYKSSYNELWKMTKLRSAQGWAEVQKATESARKSTLWKDAQKMALKAHEIIADYAFYVFTYVSNAWADLCKWYETEGHKKIGAFVDPVVVALKMTYEITKDVVLAAFEYVATFIQRSTVFLEKVLLVWQQKGFAAAIDAAFQH